MFDTCTSLTDIDLEHFKLDSIVFANSVFKNSGLELENKLPSWFGKTT